MFRVPSERPAGFRAAQPIQGAGIPASQLLVEDCVEGYLVVVVNVTERFVITACLALKVKKGDVVWQKK